MLLMSDSTNAEREGFALTEREIKSALSDIFQDAPGRIVVTLFSSHIQRMQEIYDLAHATGRKVAVSGKSLFTNIEIARELGHLRVPAGAEASLDDLPSLPDHQVVLLVTGSQGEPLSALSRLAYGEHRQIKVQKGDTVLMSSRFIPGNVRAITRLINRLYKLGAEVLYERVQAIHASGHVDDGQAQGGGPQEFNWNHADCTLRRESWTTRACRGPCRFSVAGGLYGRQ